MNSLRSSSNCEDYLLKVLIDGDNEFQRSQELVSSGPDCRRQLLDFQQLVAESKDFLAPSSLQMQRIRAKVWDEIERKTSRGFSWQPAWASAVVLGCFVLLTIILPRYFPPVAQSPLGGASVYASSGGLEVMADQLLPGTAAAAPGWIDALGGAIMESESMEQIDEMLELLIPEIGEQT